MGIRYKTATTLSVNGEDYRIFPFMGLGDAAATATLPYCLKILLENLLRHVDEDFVTDHDIDAILKWNPQAEPTQEIAFVPARVLLQDFTGVPAIVDLAAMRDAMVDLGSDPGRINPLSPVDLVIDHSVSVDHFGAPDALERNTEIEVQRNIERYRFLRWGQEAFDNFAVVPPGTGIVHQVNLEYLARTVFTVDRNGEKLAYPDTLVGTDSHTTMINGLGVLGWGVGGIEAEAAMLGQPVTMLIPQVVGFRLEGELPRGATATDLVLTVTERLRAHGVVGKFVEFFGPGLASLSLADRATIANMAPEYGATCGIFPVDAETINYLRLTGRDERQLALIEGYMREMGLWHEADTPPARYSALLEMDLGDILPSIAGPRRPQDRIALVDASSSFEKELREFQELRVTDLPESDWAEEGGPANETPTAIRGVTIQRDDQQFQLEHGAVVIAAITSCTNTSNPAILVAAGLVARKARQFGLTTPPWVKTSLAPGSKVVTAYLEKTGLMDDLNALGFHLVGYGCTTCIGNSGPLPDDIGAAIREGQLLVTSVLSGNRNFEGRIHADVRANYLASPPLVVAYALAGNMHRDLNTEGLGTTADGHTVTLAEVWPSPEEINDLVASCLSADMFRERYVDVYTGNPVWNELPVAKGERFDWPESTYVRKPTFFEGVTAEPPALKAVEKARCLVHVGDSVTTDHISPAGSIALDSPAARYLQDNGVAPKDFNSYGSRRGNHEVMIRGTFANVRLRNKLAPGTEGSWTTCFLDDSQLSIFDASEAYRAAGVPLVILAGKEYGTGSSRDWAAKGPYLLGVKAVIAESFERIHRSNLVGMGVLPLQFLPGEGCASLGLTGRESFSIPVIAPDQQRVEVTVENGEAVSLRFETIVRIDTPNEFNYFSSGGILPYVLRRLAAN
jgi:aconitate hydratase